MAVTGFRQRLKRLVLPTAITPGRIVFGPGRGVRMEIDFQHQTQTYLGLYEIELNRHLKRLCRGAAASFDVGSSVGYDSLVIAKLSGGRVIAFDFDDIAIDRFTRNMRLNPILERRIELQKKRIGNGTDGEESIDSLTSNGLPVPDFIKIDVEGAELDVLYGARRTLLARRPDLLVEVHSRELEVACARLLGAHGYRPEVVDQRWWFKERRPAPLNRWLVAYSQPSIS